VPLAAARESITAGQVVEKWEDVKARERKDEATAEKTILSGVPKTLPALLRAFELSSRAAAVGFDWEKAEDVVDKIEEEIAELKEETEKPDRDAARVEEEMGDLFFALANLARKMGVEPEAALRKANDKFQRRFTALESRVRADGYQIRDLPLHTLETYWQRAKVDAPLKEGTKDAKSTKGAK
jgi:MazG family protein